MVLKNVKGIDDHFNFNPLSFQFKVLNSHKKFFILFLFLLQKMEQTNARKMQFYIKSLKLKQ